MKKSIGGGKWFDTETAAHWKHDSSVDPETLWRTKAGQFILEVHPGMTTDYSITLIDDEAALRWLTANDGNIPDDLADAGEEV